MRPILKLYRYIADERNRIIAAAITSALLSSAAIATPLFFRYVIDQVSSIATGHSSSHVTRNIFIALVALVILSILDNVFGFIQERLGDRMAIDIEIKLERRIYEHMMRLSIDYYEQTRVGETMSKTQNALYQFISWVRTVSATSLSSIIQLILALVLLLYINLAIGILMAVMASVGIFIQAFRIQRSRKLRIEVRKADEAAYGHFHETITHIATVRSSVPSAVPVGRFKQLLAPYRELTVQMNNVQQWGNFARGMVNGISIAVGVGIISWEALNHRASPGDVAAVALYLQQVAGSAGPIGRLIVNTSEVSSSVERVTDLLETDPGVVDTPDAIDLDELKTLEFKDVCFSYPGKKHRVLDSVSFKVDPGQTLALVGPSGTGKTTITKLMLRFYEPSSGQILINGEPIEGFKAESVRKHIGMVMQDVALFNDSIEANLQLANASATKEEVRAAARQAHADIFIKQMPEQYDTKVGERGVRLSGGEKQRVAVARAILKQPDMIILDEATSALDSESERHVQAGLSQLMQGRTAVVIAHRLSTVMRADQILVLRNGKVVERGRHEDLADTQGGLYSKLFKLQSEGFKA